MRLFIYFKKSQFMKMSNVHRFQKFATQYDVFVSSADGLGTVAYDRAIVKALKSKFTVKKHILKTNEKKTIFVARLNYSTDEEKLKSIFSKYGTIENCTVIRDLITGESKNFAFIEYRKKSSAKQAIEEMNHYVIDDCKILVDFEHQRVLSNWHPRRLGGGFGGKQESGQLRFGCVDRPFRRR